jgi:phospholipase C
MRGIRRARTAPPRARAGAAWIATTVIVIELVIGTGIIGHPAAAWFAGCRGKPTATQDAMNGIDLGRSTHQWLADRAIAILKADGFDRITSFLATPDPTAPPAHDPQSGVLTGTTETFGWHLLTGATQADCALYSELPDHLHNFWSHKGRQMIVGASAASYAEKAFANAVSAWEQGDRAKAMEWLGASLHLVQDSCVPQHNFFGIGINHTPYERWVLDHEDALAVDDGAILVGTFRAEGGHGGDNWSSSHPRGWADECAHHAAGEIRSAFANVPNPTSAADPQWRTADHVAFTQRLGAGYIEFFFRTVGEP